MRNRVGIVHGVLVSLTLLLALLACKKRTPEGSSTTASATATAATTTANAGPMMPDKLFKVGEAATAPDYKMTVENVKECKVRYYFRPKKGNIKVGAEVLIEGNADKDVPVNPFYAKVTDSEGYSYTSTFAGCEPDLKTVRISKGEKARGWITFEIPEKATGLKLTYSPFIVGTLKEELKFDLGR